MLMSLSDVDECTIGGVCDNNAKCLNLFGSYHCECNGGTITLQLYKLTSNLFWN